jgi:Zn-finger nucleic acid-binding protein
MKCPLDKNDMIMVEHRKIEIDFCLECSGVWLDSGELELLVGVLNAEGADLHLNELLSKPAGQGKRRCPICAHKMNKIWLGKGAKILIDSCPRGDGLWFDAGELQKVLQEMEPAGAPANTTVIDFLGTAFQATHGKDSKG